MQERILKTLYKSFQSWLETLETVRKALTSLLLNDLKLVLFKRSKNHWKILRYHGYGGHSRYSKTVKWVYWLLHKCFSEFVIAHRRNYRVGMWKKRSKKPEPKGKKRGHCFIVPRNQHFEKTLCYRAPFFLLQIIIHIYLKSIRSMWDTVNRERHFGRTPLAACSSVLA